MAGEHDVRLSEAAIDDLFAIYLYLADRTGTARARAYVERIEAFCRSLDRFAERGRRRDDLGDGIRVVVFESRAVIAYRLSDRTVTILRVIHGPQDYDEDFFD